MEWEGKRKARERDEELVKWGTTEPQFVLITGEPHFKAARQLVMAKSGCGNKSTERERYS